MGKALLNNAFLTVLLLATACSTPKAVFESKRDPDYKGPLNRVLYVSVNQDLTDSHLNRHFSQSISDNVATALKKHGVDVETTAADSKALDPNTAVLQSAVRYRPRQVLYFGPSNLRVQHLVERNYSRRVVHTQVERLDFLAKLVDVPSHKTVWRSTMTFWFEPDPADVANQFVDKLVAEKLIAELH